MKTLLLFSFKAQGSYGRYCHDAIIADVDDYEIEEIKSYTPAEDIESTTHD